MLYTVYVLHLQNTISQTYAGPIALIPKIILKSEFLEATYDI